MKNLSLIRTMLNVCLRPSFSQALIQRQSQKLGELFVTQRLASSSQSVEEESLTLVSQENGIRHIVLNNPKKRNALSLAMLDELKEDLTDGVEKDDLQVIILSANGPAFSSGHNLRELLPDYGTEFHTKLFRRCSEVMSLIQDIPVPVIAQVRGLATAAGCQLVASCDIAVASESSRFQTPGVKNGLFCSTPGVALARAVPRKAAMEMLLTGEPISAQDALQLGLVNKVVPEEKLEETTIQLAEKICSASKPVIALGKHTFYQQIIKPRNEAYRIAESVMVNNLKYPDAHEGIGSFLEKRKPHWTHKTPQ